MTNTFTETLLLHDSLDVDMAYQNFCNIIKKAGKKTIPHGYRNNYILCWDAECELGKKLFSSITLLRRLVGSRWDANAKTLCTAALSLVYSTAEYCMPVWCRSAHTHLKDSVLNDVFCIVTGCLHPTSTDHLPIFSGIQPAELCQLGVKFSLAHCGSLDLDHILYGVLSGSSDAHQERLRSNAHSCQLQNIF